MSPCKSFDDTAVPAYIFQIKAKHNQHTLCMYLIRKQVMRAEKKKGCRINATAFLFVF
jgi:hypothetical protein